MLSEFSQKEFKYERVLVWDNIQRYKKAESPIKSDVARFIFDTFLTPDGFIQASICKDVETQLTTNNLNEKLFDELERHVERELENVFSRFVKSPKYVEYMNSGRPLIIVDRLPLANRKPALHKLNVPNRGLTLNIGDKREMSPTVGHSERFVGSPFTPIVVGSPSLFIDHVKSPVTIKSPTVGEMPRFVCSPVAAIEEKEEHHKRVASPRDFLASLFRGGFKKRKL
jgi:hypothetical protein